MNVRVVGILGLLAAACAHAPAASSAVDCGKPVEGLAPLVAPGSALIIGEVHGTVETPGLAGVAACEAAKQGPAVLGLELPPDDALTAFLASDGKAEAKAALLRSAFWSSQWQEGRRSEAMFELLEHARVWKASGLPLEVGFFDDAATLGAQARDDAMAKNVSALRAAHPTAALVLLMGNLHARKITGNPWNPSDGYRWLRTQLTFQVKSLDVAHPMGSAWICMNTDAAECGVKLVSESAVAEGRRVVSLKPNAAFDGVIQVESFTASGPAAFPERAAKVPEQIAALLSGPQSQVMKARTSARRGDFAQCAKLLGALEAPGADELYDLACCRAKSQQTAGAFDALERSVRAGFADWQSLDTDPDLESLRSDATWKTWRARVASAGK